MVHLGRGVDHFHIRHRIEVGRVHVARGMQGDLLEVRYGVDLGLRILHREHVVIPILRIDPVAGSDHAVRGQRRDHVVDGFLGRHSHASSHFAVDVELNAGIVEVLRNEHVAHATEPAHLASDLGRSLVGLFLIVAADLDVDGSRQSEIDDRIHQSSRLKVGRKFRQIISQFCPHPAHVFITADRVLFLEADLHERRVLSGIAGVDRREIRRDADVGNDHVQISRRNHLTNVGFHVLDVLVGQFQTRAGRSLDIDNELARISPREKAQTHQREIARN